MKYFVFLIICLVNLNLTAQTQGDMNLSAQKKYQVADKELNTIYQQILKEYKSDSLFIQNLKISQGLWLKLRDAELEMRFPMPDKQSYYGSVYPMCESIYLEKLTKERTKILREWLEPFQEGEVCAGSKKFKIN